jgi:hypothetical protein
MSALDSKDDLSVLGPLAPLAGVWEGEGGADVAPSDDRGTETNAYRERLTLTPCGCIDNHEQKLWGLRYATMAWRLGETDPFHEETGYWLWDPAAGEVYRCFIVPRGVSVIAGGKVAPDARRFTLEATLGSPTFGICSNPFLDREFRTERYLLDVTIHDDGTFEYAEDTQLRMPGRAEAFHHTDRHRLRRVGR